ncbi:lamin tail domain-containing protein [Archangium violaceum]|uniref:lamin tail domain-containing protein n=1 Tax=Archangium violaceum TaxID=83451 RepID=UPI00193C03F7|nr:lamin tail domain-containing protein [Archangium violaceum]QRK13346.1 lamin tail domain-containing protein [Archangium violaceum]
MSHGPPTFARLVAWSVLLLGLSVGCGSSCGGDPTPPVTREMPDADRSSVEVSRAQGVQANGEDSVDIKVTVRKEDGTPLPGRTLKVTVSGTGNTLTQPSGSTNDQGVAIATLRSTVAETKTVTVSVEAEGGPVTLSSRPTIEFVGSVVSPASRLAFSSAPSSGTAGTALGVFSVAIQNADGETVTSASNTVTVALGSGPASATLKGTVTVTAVNGVASFSDLVLEKAGQGYTLVASADGLAGATSPSFDVAPAAAATLSLTAPVGPVVVGSPVSLEVSARDAFGNDAAGYFGTVHFSSDDASATLPADYTFTAADLGRHTFDVTLNQAGSRVVTVKDTADAALSASVELSVVPGGATQLFFSKQPGDSRVRALFGVQVVLRDAAGNVVPVGEPAVTLSVDKGGTLEGGVSVLPVDGVATFSGLSIAQENSGYVLTASAPGFAPVSSEPFTLVDDVAPGAVTLSVLGKTSIQVELGWTAVGDDDLLGTASLYDLRYSTSPIDAASFDSAVPVDVGSPQAPGTAESVTVIDLSPNTLYYFALRVHDSANNTRFATVSTSTNVDPCAGFVCPPRAPTCAEDGVSLISFQQSCVDVDNTATCEESQTTTVCTGTDAVCFDAACDTAAKPTANQLSISEVMHSPSTGTSEYFELTNNTNDLLNLNGLLITYKSGSGATTTFPVGSGSTPVVIDRKGTFVLAQNKDIATNGGVSANYQYDGSIALEGSGQFKIANGATSVEEFTYSPLFWQTEGRAMSLSSLVVGTRANGNPWYWCDADVQLSGGDYGTPNAANSACGMTVTPPVDWCNIQSPKTLPDTIAGTSTEIYSQFYEPSVTDRNTAGNDGYPHVFAELGYGSGMSSAETWTWAPISFNGGYAPPVSNNDEMMGLLSIPTPGSYRYGFRYFFKDPFTGESSPYVYCDQNGIADPATGVFGTVTIIDPPVTVANHVVISEFASKNLTSDGSLAHDDEFIELYNPTNAEVDISGWKLQYKSASTTSTFSTLVTLLSGASIPAKGYFLFAYKNSSTGLGYTGSVAPDATYTAQTSHSGATLQLVNSLGSTIDRLAWGTASTAGLQPEGSPAPLIDNAIAGASLERKAVSSSTSDSMGPGGSDANRGNGYDSDDNATDFVIRAARNPQNASSPAESP